MCEISSSEDKSGLLFKVTGCTGSCTAYLYNKYSLPKTTSRTVRQYNDTNQEIPKGYTFLRNTTVKEGENYEVVCSSSNKTTFAVMDESNYELFRRGRTDYKCIGVDSGVTQFRAWYRALYNNLIISLVFNLGNETLKFSATTTVNKTVYKVSSASAKESCSSSTCVYKEIKPSDAIILENPTNATFENVVVSYGTNFLSTTASVFLGIFLGGGILLAAGVLIYAFSLWCVQVFGPKANQYTLQQDEVEVPPPTETVVTVNWASTTIDNQTPGAIVDKGYRFHL